jgi:hypothetical protein
MAHKNIYYLLLKVRDHARRDSMDGNEKFFLLPANRLL